MDGPGRRKIPFQPDKFSDLEAGQVLAALEPGRWIEGQPGLWMSTDGELLLLSPSDPLFVANLTRGA